MPVWVKYLQYFTLSFLLVAPPKFASAATLTQRRISPESEYEPPHGPDGQPPEYLLYTFTRDDIGIWQCGLPYYHPLDGAQLCAATPEWSFQAGDWLPGTAYEGIDGWGRSCTYLQTAESYGDAPEHAVIGHLDCLGWNRAECFKSGQREYWCGETSGATLIPRAHCHWDPWVESPNGH